MRCGSITVLKLNCTDEVVHLEAFIVHFPIAHAREKATERPQKVARYWYPPF